MRASYREAVVWIAINEETAEFDVEVIKDDVCVCLVADVWGKENLQVAKDVLRERKKDQRRT